MKWSARLGPSCTGVPRRIGLQSLANNNTHAAAIDWQEKSRKGSLCQLLLTVKHVLNICYVVLSICLQYRLLKCKVAFSGEKGKAGLVESVAAGVSSSNWTYIWIVYLPHISCFSKLYSLTSYKVSSKGWNGMVDSVTNTGVSLRPPVVTAFLPPSGWLTECRFGGLYTRTTWLSLTCSSFSCLFWGRAWQRP